MDAARSVRGGEREDACSARYLPRENLSVKQNAGCTITTLVGSVEWNGMGNAALLYCLCNQRAARVESDTLEERMRRDRRVVAEGSHDSHIISHCFSI